MINNMLVALFLASILQVSLAAFEPFQSFGLLTVTHSRKDDYSVLENYLKRYTQTQCYKDLLSEINIVWNNQVPPEETVLYKYKKMSQIKVNFFRTTFNSMDHRYRLPHESSAQLLYSLDDDIIVDCQTFKITLQKFNSVNKDLQVGRITTNQVRAFGYDPNKGLQFYYQGHPTALYFTIAQPGAAFIPRHYLQLYYMKLNQLKYLHDIVLDVKNCDDIFFWAIVQHFYPQLPGVYVKGQKNYKNTDPKIGQSKVKNVYTTRHNCINNISNAFGYNPLRHFSKNSSKYLDNWQYPNLDLILTQKIAGLAEVEKTVAEEKPPTPGADKNDDWKIQRESKADIAQKANQQKQSLKPEIREGSAVKEAETQNQWIKSEEQHKKQTVTQKRTTQKGQSSSPKSNKGEDVLQEVEEVVVKASFQLKVAVLLTLLLILLAALYRAYRRHQQTARLYSQRLDDNDDQQQMYSSSIRLPDHY